MSHNRQAGFGRRARLELGLRRRLDALELGVHNRRHRLAAHQPPRPRAGVLAVPTGDFAGDDRRVVADRSLHQPRAARRQVVHRIRKGQVQALEVDHIEVGPLAQFNAAPVVEAVEIGGLRGDPPDALSQGEAIAAMAVPGPMGEHVGRDRGVADGVAMGPAVAQADHRVAVEQLLVQGVVIGVGVVEKRK